MWQPILLLQKLSDPNQKGHLITSSNSPTKARQHCPTPFNWPPAHTNHRTPPKCCIKETLFTEAASLVWTPSYGNCTVSPHKWFQTLILLAARKPCLISRLNLSNLLWLALVVPLCVRLKSPPPSRNKWVFLPVIILSPVSHAGTRKATKAGTLRSNTTLISLLPMDEHLDCLRRNLGGMCAVFQFLAWDVLLLWSELSAHAKPEERYFYH